MVGLSLSVEIDSYIFVETKRWYAERPRDELQQRRESNRTVAVCVQNSVTV